MSELEPTAMQYIKYEILANEHGICGRERQSDYCVKQLNKCFFALETLIGHSEAMNLINRTSEYHYNEIEKKVLGL